MAKRLPVAFQDNVDAIMTLMRLLTSLMLASAKN